MEEGQRVQIRLAAINACADAIKELDAGEQVRVLRTLAVFFKLGLRFYTQEE